MNNYSIIPYLFLNWRDCFLIGDDRDVISQISQRELMNGLYTSRPTIFFTPVSIISLTKQQTIVFKSRIQPSSLAEGENIWISVLLGFERTRNMNEYTSALAFHAFRPIFRAFSVLMNALDASAPWLQNTLSFSYASGVFFNTLSVTM